MNYNEYIENNCIFNLDNLKVLYEKGKLIVMYTVYLLLLKRYVIKSKDMWIQLLFLVK